MKEAKHKRTTTVLFQFYEVCRLVKFTEVENSNRMVIAMSSEKGRWGFMLHGYKFLFAVMKTF